MKVAPTSSTRTVLPLGKKFMIKLNLDILHSRFRRRLRGNSVEHSIRVSQEMEIISKRKDCPKTFAYMPESLGIIWKNQGVLFREMKAYPLIEDKRYLIPYFCLYSHDIKNPKDKPLLVQLIEYSKENPKTYFLQKIIKPIIDNWTFCVKEHGIVLEPHGQNVLLEVDENFIPKRAVHRDFQSMYIDRQIRIRKNLPLDFKKHWLGEETKKTESYSLVYDHYVGNYLFANMIKVMREHFGICEAKLDAEIRKIFRNNLNPDKYFPKNFYYRMAKCKFKDNKTILIRSEEKPRFR